MTRKCVWAGFPFVGGLILCGAFRSRFNLIFLLTALGLGVLFFFGTKRRKETVVCTLFFLCGIMTNSLYTHNVYEKLIALDGKTVTVSGYVSDCGYIGSDTSIVTVKGKVNGINTEITFFLPYDNYRYYDRISVKGKVSEVKDSISFQSGEYYYSKGVFLQGKSSETVEWNGECCNVIFRAVKEYRDRLLVKIHSVCSGDEGAFLSAMLCGDKSEMSQSMKTAMYRSGIGHIFAVSGAHLVIVSALFSAAISVVIKRRKTVYVMTLIEIWGFALFAGFSVSVVRAAIMLTIGQSGFVFGRKSDCMNSLGLSAILLTVSAPYSALSPSFVLSFTAVFAMGVIAPEIIKKMSSEKPVSMLTEYAVGSACVLMLTAPVSAVFFGGLSVMSVVTNLLLVPICTLALQISFLTVLTGGWDLIAVPALKLAGIIVKPVIKAVDIISSLSFSYVTAENKILLITVAITALLTIAAGILSKKKHAFSAICTTVIALWLFMSNISALTNKDINITALPNGKNSVYIVCSGNKAAVINIGAMNKYNGAVERFICGRRINTISGVFVFDDCYYNISEYENDLSVSPKLYFARAGSDYFRDTQNFQTGDFAEINSMKITCTDDGYTVEFDGNTYYLRGNGFKINGEDYDTTGEQFPLEINNEDLTIRRLDYGFN